MFDKVVANYPFYIAFYCSSFLTILEGVKIFDCILLQSDCKRCKRAFKVARRLKWTFFRVKLTDMIAKWLHFIAFIFDENCKNVANYCKFFLKNRQNFKFFLEKLQIIAFLLQIIACLPLVNVGLYIIQQHWMSSTNCSALRTHGATVVPIYFYTVNYTISQSQNHSVIELILVSKKQKDLTTE